MSLASTITLQSAGVGLVVSAVQNALGKHDRGAMGIVTRSGGTIAFFTALGFSFSFAQSVTANMRETDDALNSAAGGCAAGFIAGVRARSLPTAVGYCAFLGTLMGTFDAAGNSLTGDKTKLEPGEEGQTRPFFKERKMRGLEREPAAPAS